MLDLKDIKKEFITWLLQQAMDFLHSLKKCFIIKLIVRINKLFILSIEYLLFTYSYVLYIYLVNIVLEGI